MNGNWQAWTLIIVAGLSVIGWALPGQSSFSKTVADTLYCSISSANCYTLYCATVAAQAPNNCVSGGGFPFWEAHSSTKTTKTSTTFVTLLTAGLQFNPGLFTGNDFAICQANAIYDLTVASAVADFRITDLAGTGNQFSTNWRVGPDLNANATLAISNWFSFDGTPGTETFSLQVKVSGAAASVTIFTQELVCYGATQNSIVS